MQGLRIAYFVSAHGFGHAARSAAVMEAAGRLRPGVSFDLYTMAPAWLFADSLTVPYRLRRLEVDVGLVQTTPFDADAAATAERLERFTASWTRLVPSLARDLRAAGCRAVVCDIAPLGLAVAQRAGLPALLIENFTWDWIYAAYAASVPALRTWGRRFAALFEAPDVLRVQTEPVCAPCPRASRVGPVSRRPHRTRQQVRSALGLTAEQRFVLVTMGGSAWDQALLERWGERKDLVFVVPGGRRPRRRLPGLLRLPERSPVFHPDLVAAADAVVGKLGYSTVAEAWCAGTPFAYLERTGFPESPCLARFVSTHLPSLRIARDGFGDGAWLDDLPRLWQTCRRPAPRPSADEAAARLLLEALSG